MTRKDMMIGIALIIMSAVCTILFVAMVINAFRVEPLGNVVPGPNPQNPNGVTLPRKM